VHDNLPYTPYKKSSVCEDVIEFAKAIYRNRNTIGMVGLALVFVYYVNSFEWVWDNPLHNVMNIVYKSYYDVDMGKMTAIVTQAAVVQSLPTVVAGVTLFSQIVSGAIGIGAGITKFAMRFAPGRGAAMMA
jgi:hypothetical protein